MKKPRALTPEELAIWHESNRHTTLLPSSNANSHANVTGNTAAIEPHQPAKLDMAAPIHPVRLKSSKPLPAISRREATKRFKQYPDIEAVLDLHGLNKFEAMDAVQRFITRQQRAGHRHVVIITGKGRGTAMGVLRAALPDWLSEPPLRALISTVTHAQPEKGGEGVTHVLLKRS